MRQFRQPPDWPEPPTPRWRPPRRWKPPATWPTAPRGWTFWVDQKGNPVRGPIGRYGGPGLVMTSAIVLIPLALMALVIVNPLRNGESVSSVPSVATSNARPKAAASATTSAGPTTQPAGTPSPLSEQTTASSSPTASPTPTPTSVTPEPGQTSTTTAPPDTSVVPVTAVPPQTQTSTSTGKPTPTPTAPTTTLVFKNCDEARAAGKAPLYRGDPGYSAALDHNGDGVACGDRGNS